MRCTVIFFFLIVQSALPAVACGNEYETYTHTMIDGKTKELDYSNSRAYYFNHGFDRNALNEEKEKLVRKIKKDKSFKYRSDLALILLKLGESKHALSILQELIKKHPGEYNVAANLGTAYELNGMNDSALVYIKKAIKINPDSHQGSEWIHVKILEAKIKMEKDKGWLKRNSILGMDLKGRVMKGERPKEEALDELMLLKKQLAWQLTERVAFVAPSDPVVADLLFDLANLVALTAYLEHSIYVYNQSLDYSPADINAVLRVRDHVNGKIYQSRINGNMKWIFIFIMIMSGIIFMIWRIRKKRKAKKRNPRTIMSSEPAL